MSFAVLYLSDGYKIKSFTGKTAGKKSIVTINIEISDLCELGSFLKSVAQAQQELQTAKTAPADCANEGEI